MYAIISCVLLMEQVIVIVFAISDESLSLPVGFRI